jgi:hypothetical protein
VHATWSPVITARRVLALQIIETSSRYEQRQSRTGVKGGSFGVEGWKSNQYMLAKIIVVTYYEMLNKTLQ